VKLQSLEFKEQGTPETSAAEAQKITAANAAALKKAQEALGKIKANTNFSQVVTQYNESSSSSSWIDAENSPDLAAKVAALKVGGTTDVVETAQGYTIAKLIGSRQEINQITNQPKVEVKAAHLLICYSGSQGCTASTTKDEALAKIKALAKTATPQNFSQLVKKNSTERVPRKPAASSAGFGQGMMVQPFEDAVFPQKVGTISFVVETKFGYHLIYKEAQRNVEEYNVQTIFIPKTQANTASSSVKLGGDNFDRKKFEAVQRPI